MALCIPKEDVDKMAAAFRQGVLAPERLVGMQSYERTALFKDIVGNEALAREINVNFESKLVLESQKRGIENWKKTIRGDKPTVDVNKAVREIQRLEKQLESGKLDVFERRDAIRRIEKLQDKISGNNAAILEDARKDVVGYINRLERVLDADSKQAFLRTLAETKLGFKVTYEQAQIITKLTKKMKENRAKIKDDMPDGSPERLDYGRVAYQLKKYIEVLKKEDISFKEWITNADLMLDSVAGTLKSIAASMDNSFFFRQGLQGFVYSPKTWLRNYIKSWQDIGKELGGKDAMMMAEARAFSNKNALDGHYERAGLDAGIAFEEAYPSALPRRIMGLRRLYKASESAFSNGALRMRTEIFDLMLEQAKRSGVDIYNTAEMRKLGEFANSITGRGKIKGAGHKTNILLFSPRWMKSRWDVLTAAPKYALMKGGQAVGKSYTPAEIFVRRKAAWEVTKLISATATLLFIAEQLNPGSVTWDPRSTDFGKVKIGNTRFDLSAGLGAFITLAFRMVPTYHNGDWGLWAIDSKGRYRKQLDIDSAGISLFEITKPSFIARTPLNYLGDFLLNKTAPVMSPLVTIYRGRSFGGERVTAPNLAIRALTPIPVQTWYELWKDPESADMIWAMLAEISGIGTNTY